MPAYSPTNNFGGGKFQRHLTIAIQITSSTNMFNSIAKRTGVQSVRAFSTSRVAATKGTVSSGSKAFDDKEQAQENMYIRKHEQEQLQKLREKLDQQKATIDKLQKDVDSLKK